MNCSTPGLPVHHQLPKFTQTRVHRVGDAIQPSLPLSSPSPPAPNPSQHKGLFQSVNSSREVAKVIGVPTPHPPPIPQRPRNYIGGPKPVPGSESSVSSERQWASVGVSAHLLEPRHGSLILTGLTPLTLRLLRPLAGTGMHTTCFPGSPACRQQIVGLLSLHNRVSQFFIIHLILYINIRFLWRTLTNTES